MSKKKKSSAKRRSRRPQPRPTNKRGKRWTEDAHGVVLSVITYCAQTYAHDLIAHIINRR